MTQPPIEIPPPTGIFAEPFSFNKLVRQMGFFGPAAVVASLGLGAGETIMVTGLGAWSEFGLLWLLVLSVLVKGIFVTYLIGRYTAITGQSVGHRLLLLPGPRGWLLMMVVLAEVGLLSMGMTTVAKPCGNLFAFLIAGSASPETFSFWENLSTSLFLGAALVVSVFCSYQALEKQQVFICALVVLGTVVATCIVRPDVSALIMGAIRFGSLPDPPEWAPAGVKQEYMLQLVTVFGYVGGSLSGYLAYSNWVSLSGWGLNSHEKIDALRARANMQRRIDYLPDDPEQARRLHILLTPLRWDVGMGAVVLFVVTAAFLTAGATVLFPRAQPIGNNAWELLTRQAGIWREIHQALVPVYYVAVVAAMWGTLASVPEAITRVTHEFLSEVWPSFQRVSVPQLKRWIVSWFFLTSLIWTWAGLSFGLLTQIAAFLTANLGLSIVSLCVLYFNATLPTRYRPRWWLLAGGTLSSLILLACAIGGGVGLARKLFGV